jgi:3-isopropylmalate/(R)-2-methylmalate dehydratase large subunit
MGKTVVEKILARAAGLPAVSAGDVVEPRVDVAMSHENAALVINQFLEIYEGTGIEAHPWDVSKIAIIFDHRVPAESPKTASNQKKIREFVDRHKIARFHDIRGDVGGICHQILPEYGYVRPGQVVVGTDSHTTSHGALGAFSFGIGATEMASVWTLGVALNIEVPTTIKIEVNGEFGPHVGPKDLILHVVGTLTAQGANFRVLEFHGETMRKMSTSGRLAVCNMSVEAGATSGIVPADEETIRYLREEAGVTDPIEPVVPDADAVYERVVTIDVSTLEPQIACPHGRQRQADLRGRRREGPPDRHRLLHERPDRRPRSRRRDHSREEGRPGNADARLPRLGPRLPGGARPGLRLRLHEGGRRRHERRLRPLPRRPRGGARRQRGRRLHHEPQLQGTDGKP